MYIFVLTLFIYTFQLFLSANSMANEGAPPAGGHGEAAAPAPAGPKPETWNEIQAKVQAYETMVKAKEESIKSLMRQKATVTDGASVKALEKQIKREHNDLRDVMKQYEEARNKLIYRFPERFSKGERKYKRIEVKSVEEMEDQLSLESSMATTIKKAESKYGKKENVRLQKSQPSSEGDGHLHEPKESGEDSLTAPVIIKK
jgi:hypothetical protein